MNDAGCWPDLISDATRLRIVRNGSSSIQNLEYDFAEKSREGSSVKGDNRSLTKDWFFRRLPNGEKVLRSWLIYSPYQQSIFCFCCKLFSDGKSNSAFASKDGFCKWWKLNPKVKEHETSQFHNQYYLQWKELEMRLQSGSTIDDKEQQVVQMEAKKWKEVLIRILDIIRFLAKQNMPLRGHRENVHSVNSPENEGNFLELVHLLAKYDPVLREHMAKAELGKRQILYLSPKIQNEFIEALGANVRNKILAEIKEAKYYSIILDSTPDVSHKDQMSQVLRYVSIIGKQVEIKESFIDFLEVEGKTSEDVSNLISNKLEIDGLDIQNCRGQAYDNASVMAGKHAGVQARIKETNPKADFVACTNHSLNLVGVHAASVAINSVTFFGTVERVYVFFSSSTHRWNILTSKIKHGVKRIVETRWSARCDAVKALKMSYSEILNVLEELTSENENLNTRSDAGILLTALQTYPFLSFLHLWDYILTEINDTQKYLQIKGLNLAQCDSKLMALKDLLLANRTEFVDKSILSATGLCESLGIVMEKRCRRKKRMPGEKASDAGLSFKDEIRREMLLVSDKCVLEMTTRFEQMHALASKYGFLSPSNLLNGKYSCDVTNFSDDISAEDFEAERKRLASFVNASSEKEELRNGGPLEMLRFIVKYEMQSSVPNTVVMLRIFLTAAISVASCERSFSKLKLIKSYLRSTMSTMRLSSLAVLSIEREVAEEIDFDGVIGEFAKKKSRRVDL